MVTASAVHRLEDPLEVGALHGRSLFSARRRPPSSRATIISRIAVDAIALEEHVLRSAQPDAFSAEASRDARVARSIGVWRGREACALCPPTQEACAYD